MADNAVMMSLAKVIVAAAWADGQIDNDEINSLKDLLFFMPGMTASDWAQIDIYTHSPVGEAERDRLVGELEEKLKTQEDKEFVLQALDALLAADGAAGTGELEAVERIKAGVQEVGFSSWSRFVHGRTAKRSQAVQTAPNRELLMGDFVNNTIFYDARMALGDSVQISDDELRKLCLAGGLLARVAYADQQVSGVEDQAILTALQTYWSASPEQAAAIAKAAEANIQADLDYFRLTRSFFEVTSEAERVSFLDVLFALTTSDGQASYAEIEEIRQIAGGLLLTHQQFIEAKKKVAKEQREE